MGNLKKILTIEEEREVDSWYYKIYAWYIEELKEHKEYLPDDVFAHAKAALTVFLLKARELRENKNLVAIREHAKQIYWFMYPWQVTMSYSYVTKNKEKEKKECSVDRTLHLKKSPKSS